MTLVVLLAAGLAGCGEEIPEALAEQATGVDVEIGGADASPPAEARTDDEFSPDDEGYPAQLPDEFPLLGGMELVNSSVEEADDGTRVTMETVDLGDFDAAVVFYEDELTANGWTVADTGRGDEGEQDAVRTQRWEVEGFGWTGSVELREEGEVGDLGGVTTRLLVELRTSG